MPEIKQTKFDGKWVMRCKKHGTPYSVYYSAAHFTREEAARRIEEFRVGHIMFSPDCSLDAVCEDVLA